MWQVGGCYFQEQLYKECIIVWTERNYQVYFSGSQGPMYVKVTSVILSATKPQSYFFQVTVGTILKYFATVII